MSGPKKSTLMNAYSVEQALRNLALPPSPKPANALEALLEERYEGIEKALKANKPWCDIVIDLAPPGTIKPDTASKAWKRLTARRASTVAVTAQKPRMGTPAFRAQVADGFIQSLGLGQLQGKAFADTVGRALLAHVGTFEGDVSFEDAMQIFAVMERINKLRGATGNTSETGRPVAAPTSVQSSAPPGNQPPSSSGNAPF